MVVRTGTDVEPPEFRRAVASVRSARLRPEVTLDETAGPTRLATHTAAFLAEVTAGDEELASGRLVILYEPGGHVAWSGEYRLVSYVRAALEPEIAADPLLPGVGWTWLMEALEEHGASFAAPSGTVTRVISESFGSMADDPAASEIEVRASWTARDHELGRHAVAWGELLCHVAGLPPLPAGVATLSARGAGPRSGAAGARTRRR